MRTKSKSIVKLDIKFTHKKYLEKLKNVFKVSEACLIYFLKCQGSRSTCHQTTWKECCRIYGKLQYHNHILHRKMNFKKYWKWSTKNISIAISIISLLSFLSIKKLAFSLIKSHDSYSYIIDRLWIVSYQSNIKVQH